MQKLLEPRWLEPAITCLSNNAFVDECYKPDLGSTQSLETKQSLKTISGHNIMSLFFPRLLIPGASPRAANGGGAAPLPIMAQMGTATPFCKMEMAMQRL